ncbi:MFS transporter [Blastococcus xanthinilyticus]|uniref:AAHS family benzoate transporter-like MFS transporter n=1 Tax=Blastococcus xanthinilyticus TaxID=1564164 RepID=A0A5S5D4Y5_9ACTN|nr:MFS transporter [Blastococcus xanthinilyticus]TYP90484.1 AAHS family benzoate transporter-like MFS transporter [Blastococcus xanthinilyticus]
MATGTPQHQRSGPVLLLGVLVLFIDGYDLFILGAVGPSLLQYEPWGATPATLGMLGSITAVGGALGAVVAGWAGDVYGRRLPMMLSLAWVSLWMAASAVAPSLGLFAFTRFAVGIGLGALIPLVVAVVTEAAPSTRRSLWVGIAMTGVAFGGLGAAFAARALLGSAPFQQLFLIGAVAVVLLPLVWRLVPGGAPVVHLASELSPAATGSRAAQLLAPANRRATLLFWAATFLGLVVVYGASTFLPTLMVNAGYDLNSSLEFLITFNAGAILGTLVVTALADRGRLQAITVGCALVAAAAFLVLSTPQARWLLLVMAAAAGLGALGTQNLVNSYVARYHEPRLRGTALGFSLGVGRLGAIAGPLYLSAVTVAFTSPKAGFYAFIVPAVLGALVISLIPRQRTEHLVRAAPGVAAPASI